MVHPPDVMINGHDGSKGYGGGCNFMYENVSLWTRSDALISCQNSLSFAFSLAKMTSFNCSGINPFLLALKSAIGVRRKLQLLTIL